MQKKPNIREEILAEHPRYLDSHSLYTSELKSLISRTGLSVTFPVVVIHSQAEDAKAPQIQKSSF